MITAKQLFIILVTIIISISAFAQEAEKRVAMADTMRSEGRIYVVVAVMLTILIGLILYLVILDRKIRKWEKIENKNL